MIGKPARQPLADAPHHPIDADDPADAGQADPLPVEEDRQEHPDQRIDKFLHQSRLAQGSKAPVAPTHRDEHIDRRRLRWQACRIARTKRRCAGPRCCGLSLRARPRQGVCHGQPGQQERRHDDCEAEHQQTLAGAQPLRRVAGDDAGDGDPDVAGQFVEANDDAALVGTREIELGRLRDGPCETLVHPQQQGREHHPVPARRKKYQCGNRQCRQPAGKQHFLPPVMLRGPTGDEIHHALDEAEGNDKGHQQHEGTAWHAELAVGQCRYHGPQHSERHADQEDLQQLQQELAPVDPDAIA